MAAEEEEEEEGVAAAVVAEQAKQLAQCWLVLVLGALVEEVSASELAVLLLHPPPMGNCEQTVQVAADDGTVANGADDDNDSSSRNSRLRPPQPFSWGCRCRC